jgi:hypothetical protein
MEHRMRIEFKDGAYGITLRIDGRYISSAPQRGQGTPEEEARRDRLFAADQDLGAVLGTGPANYADHRYVRGWGYALWAWEVEGAQLRNAIGILRGHGFEVDQ